MLETRIMFPKRILGSPTNYSKPLCVCVTDKKCVVTHIAGSFVYENFHLVTRPFPFLVQ